MLHLYLKVLVQHILTHSQINMVIQVGLPLMDLTMSVVINLIRLVPLDSILMFHLVLLNFPQKVLILIYSLGYMTNQAMKTHAIHTIQMHHYVIHSHMYVENLMSINTLMVKNTTWLNIMGYGLFIVQNLLQIVVIKF